MAMPSVGTQKLIGGAFILGGIALVFIGFKKIK